MGDLIIGRDSELAAVERFLSAQEWPRTLVLAGEAGIGKSTLWRAAGERAARTGFDVLTTRPLEAEAKLAYAGVGDLLSEAHAAFDELPAPQSHALRAALLLEEPPAGGVDERGVSLGLRAVLRALAREQPVLVSVDDVQWLDGPSARALASVARRLDADRIAFLLALRSEARTALPYVLERVFPAHTELPVRPLGLEDVHALLRKRLGLALSRPTVRAVHVRAGGNPYFALELGRTLGETPGAHHSSVPPALPATLRELTEARVTAFDVATRDALAAAAALADPTVALVEAAAGRDGSVALAPAIEQDVVAVTAGRIRFSHPLLSAAAYAAVDAGRRRELHAAFAELVEEPEARARHLALAAVAPSADVAAALDDAAALARGRGAPVEAAELLEEARALTPPDAETDGLRRGVLAAGHYFEAGDTWRARALLDEVLPRLPAGVERARALITLARVRSYDDDIRAAVGLLEEAIAQGGGEALVAGRAHEILSGILFRLRERFVEAVEHARAAAEIARAAGDAELLANALGSQLLAEAALGMPEAQQTFAAAAAAAAAGRGTRALGGSEFPVAVVQLWWELVDEAKSGFEQMLARAEAIGDESSIPYLHVLLAQAACLRGDPGAAAAHADRGAARAEQVGQETLAAYALALRALAAAYRGEEELARATARRALRLAGSTSGRPAEHFATAALGLLELSLERYADAVEVLSPLVAFARTEEMREPGLTRFVPDLVEALVGVGRLDEAEEQLTWFAVNADRLERSSARGGAARCRGFLAAARGDAAAALSCFERALAHHDAAPIPFDRARTLLALGSARRRAKERRAARAALEEARDVFRSLEARIWEGRAGAELARIGGRAPSAGELTPAERRVAELVAAGRTNKEVAVALYLSTRTVEGHLSRVYDKLGVRSRVELARKLA